MPLLAGQCAAPGVAGIFAFSGGSWHRAGPALPAALAQRRVSVLRLTAAGRSTLALLTATAPDGAASLIAGWATATGRWALSAPLPLDGARILSTATGTAFGAYPRPGRHRRPPQSGQRGRGHPEHRARRDDH